MSDAVSLEFRVAQRVAEINNIVTERGWKLVKLTIPEPKKQRNPFGVAWLALKHYLRQSETAEPYSVNSYMLVPQKGDIPSDQLAYYRLMVVGLKPADLELCCLSQINLHPDRVSMITAPSYKWKDFPISVFYEALGKNLWSLKPS